MVAAKSATSATRQAVLALEVQQEVRDPKVEQILRSFGIEPSIVMDVPSSSFDHEASTGNQARFDPIDKDVVNQYERDLRSGSVFPAVVAVPESRSGGRTLYTIVDGNHRLKAHTLAGQALAVYEIPEDTDPTIVVQLTYVLNKPHGKALDLAEKLAHAYYLVQTNVSKANAVEMTGLKNENQLNKYIKLMAADERATKARVPKSQWKAIKSEESRIRIGAITTDPGLRAFVALVARAGLTTDVVSKCVGAINRQHGSSEQIKYIEDVLADQYAEIEDPSGGKLNSGNNRSTRMRLGGVFATLREVVEDPATTAALYRGPERAKKAADVAEAIAALTKLKAALEADENAGADEK